MILQISCYTETAQEAKTSRKLSKYANTERTPHSKEIPKVKSKASIPQHHQEIFLRLHQLCIRRIRHGSRSP